MTRAVRTMALTVLAPLSAAWAQSGGGFDVSWNTIDGGGGVSSGGGFSISGTAGQPDAGPAMTGGSFIVAGGFWAAPAAPPCYANCDASTVPPILNVNDFNCFLNRFTAADPYANCDGSTTPPVLNVNDFICFLNRFAAGCP